GRAFARFVVVVLRSDTAWIAASAGELHDVRVGWKADDRVRAVDVRLGERVAVSADDLDADAPKGVSVRVGHNPGDARARLQVGIDARARLPTLDTHPTMLGQVVARTVAEATGIELDEISPACQALQAIGAGFRCVGIGEFVAAAIRGHHADSGERLAGCAPGSHDARDASARVECGVNVPRDPRAL